jgi:hypothetical protein
MAMVFDEELDHFVATNNESATRRERKRLLSNHTGYGKGGESWEHDDTGHVQNFSGCYDDMLDPVAEHEGWEEGYDY